MDGLSHAVSSESLRGRACDRLDAEGVRPLSPGSPLRYYMDIILGIFLEGTGWRELWQEALALLAIGSGLFGLALVAFRCRIV